MRCSNSNIFIRTLIISSFAVGSGALNVLAQTPVTDTAKPVTVWTFPKADSYPTFLKNLTIESFGFDLKQQAPGFQFSLGYTSTFFNLNGLECPRCVPGPVDRDGRFTLPPFGAKATLKLQDGRVQLFGGFAALEA